MMTTKRAAVTNNLRHFRKCTCNILHLLKKSVKKTKDIRPQINCSTTGMYLGDKRASKSTDTN